MPTHTITTRDALRSIYKPPGEGAVKKVLSHLDPHSIAFIARSPFCVLSTSDHAGRLDASPKGGDPGFLKVRDASTVLLPDWPGNNRLDSLENILDTPQRHRCDFDRSRVAGRAGDCGQAADYGARDHG
jgi:uncharacterized protein